MENLETQKLRVAMILPSLDHKGPIILARNIIKALNHVVDFELFYFDPIVAMQFEVKTTQISFFHLPDFSQFDLIHCHMLRPDLYVVWHRLNKRKPLVSTLHQYIDDVLLHSYNKPIQWFFGNLWKLALSRMSAVVCINGDQTQFYTKEKLNTHLLTIHNGVEEGEAIDVPERERISELKRNFTLIGSLAVIRKIKGIEQTFALLSKHPHLYYLHIGNGEDEAYYETLAKEMGIENRVWFLGYKENPKSYLQLLDVYVATSRSEGFGMALVEAVVAKVPVACTKIPSFMEMFTDSEVSFFDLDNVDSMQTAVNKAILDKNNLIKLAYERYLSSYSMEILGRNYLSLFQKLAGRR